MALALSNQVLASPPVRRATPADHAGQHPLAFPLAVLTQIVEPSAFPFIVLAKAVADYISRSQPSLAFPPLIFPLVKEHQQQKKSTSPQSFLHPRVIFVTVKIIASALPFRPNSICLFSSNNRENKSQSVRHTCNPLTSDLSL